MPVTQDPDVIWVESYVIEIDALIALPLWTQSIHGIAAIKRGIIRVVSDSDAKARNEKFANEGHWAIQYLHENLAKRWAVIAEQRKRAAQCP